MVEPLHTADANWLIQQPRREPAWVVEDLMPTGLHLLTVFLIAFIFRKSRDKSFGFHDDCFAS